MKTQFASSAAAVAVLASAVSAQGQGHPGGNGWNGAPSGAPSGAPWAGAGGGPSCLVRRTDIATIRASIDSQIEQLLV